MEVRIQSNEMQRMREELRDIILNKGIVWGSGLSPDNHVYNWTSDSKSYLLDQRGLFLTTTLFLNKIKNYEADMIGGITMAAHIITAGCLKLGDNLNGFMIRRQRKQTGLLKIIEGPSVEKKRVVIIDDNINEGGRAQEAVKAVESEGGIVVGFISLVDFESEDHLLLKKQGYVVESIYTSKDFGMDTRIMPSKMDMFNLKWRYSPINIGTYAAAKSTPIVHDGKIYVGSDQGKLHCIDFDGKLVWEFKTDFHEHGVHSTPVGIKEKVIITGYDGSIYAVNKDKGSLIWKNKICSYIGSSPVYDSDTNMIYIGLENNTGKGTLACLSADDGKLVWEISTNAQVASWAAFNKEIIVFGSNDRYLYACAKNGKLIWKFRTGGQIKRGITIDLDKVYVSSNDGFLYCLNINSGKEVWKRKLGYRLFNEPLIVDDKVIVGSYSGQLTALNKVDGRILWYFLTQGSIQSSPVYDKGLIYFGSHDNNVYVVDAQTGKFVWNFLTGGKVSATPCVYEDKLFISSNDSFLYCFERKK